MNEREVLTVCHVCSMVPPHSCWSLVKLSMYVVYYVASYPGVLGKRTPGIYCLRMRVIKPYVN